MDAKWNLTPWMQRRIARHIERGSSPRMVQCLLNGAGKQRTSEIDPEVKRAAMPLFPPAENVILFRNRRLVA